MSDRVAKDTISRQAAIDAMEESKTIFHDRKTIIGKMQDIVNNLPSVQSDMSGYSDRLWKLAYERGKRDTYTEMEGAEDAGRDE